MNSQNPLVEISELVKMQLTARQKVAVIFDLDSTLFCVSPRSQAILRKLGGQREFSEAHLEASKILRDIEILPTDWGIRSALERRGFPWDEELARLVRNFWRDHFFSNNFLNHDTIYPSANEYVSHLHEMGADILYLTGRNEGSMKSGTIKMLQRWGFPYFSDSKLYMKSNDVESDEGYKAKVLENLVRDYDHIWFFENEPVIIAQVRALVPKVHLVFVDSVHSGKGSAPKDLPTIGMSYERK